jgi:hypothetical protein
LQDESGPVYVSNMKNIPETNGAENLSIVTIGKYLKSMA